MSDDEFLAAFHACALEEFHHRDHLRLTWIVLRKSHVDDAVPRIAAAIRHFAEHHGQSDKYHQTMTEFWVRLVDHAKSRHPGSGSFNELTAAAPHLLDKRLPWQHWSHEQLMSSEARISWIDPDLAPVPWQPNVAATK